MTKKNQGVVSSGRQSRDIPFKSKRREEKNTVSFDFGLEIPVQNETRGSELRGEKGKVTKEQMTVYASHVGRHVEGKRSSSSLSPKKEIPNSAQVFSDLSFSKRAFSLPLS